MTTISNVINGSAAVREGGGFLSIVDPSTCAEYAQAPKSSAHDVGDACAAAAAAFSSWSRTTPRHRQDALLDLAGALAARTTDFADAEARNTGKPRSAALGEVEASIDVFRFYAGAARLLEGTSAGEYVSNHTSMVRREPVGVCAQVAPWNYPLMMAAWKVAPALAAGNTVVLKPSDTTPVSTSMLGSLAADVLPPGVLNVICGDRETGRDLVAHPTPDMVSITGSQRAGIEVATSAAAGLKRVHLELGGNAPVLIFDDADLERAAATVADAGFTNAGQDCTAATRVIVHAAVHEQFLALLRPAVEAMRAGPPSDPTAHIGPLNNPQQWDRVSGLLSRLPDRANVLQSREVLPDVGYFLAPTVITGVQQQDEVVSEEIFGPVVTVQTFAGETEAVALANDTVYGLASSVWTADHARALRISAQLDFGCVWINTHMTFATEMPHGGFKHSGYGNDLSAYSFDDYTRIKHVMSYIGD